MMLIIIGNKAIYDAHNNRQGYDSVPNQYGSN